MSDDPRRGLPSASKMERIANCPGSLALENQIRKTGRIFELPDSARDSGLKIHNWLASGGMNESTLNADERATAKMCVELRNIILAQWETQK